MSGSLSIGFTVVAESSTSTIAAAAAVFEAPAPAADISAQHRQGRDVRAQSASLQASEGWGHGIVHLWREAIVCRLLVFRQKEQKKQTDERSHPYCSLQSVLLVEILR
jgi:hypothetical protein